mmetsp:Transcript_29140/g.73170  ORF Transcript_29140/g.73170 Transcript_29140/m.73170 type:complete len:289 (+) Transcript_29140:118-984(+)
MTLTSTRRSLRSSRSVLPTCVRSRPISSHRSPRPSLAAAPPASSRVAALFLPRRPKRSHSLSAAAPPRTHAGPRRAMPCAPRSAKRLSSSQPTPRPCVPWTCALTTTAGGKRGRRSEERRAAPRRQTLTQLARRRCSRRRARGPLRSLLTRALTLRRRLWPRTFRFALSVRAQSSTARSPPHAPDRHAPPPRALRVFSMRLAQRARARAATYLHRQPFTSGSPHVRATSSTRGLPATRRRRHWTRSSRRRRSRPPGSPTRPLTSTATTRATWGSRRTSLSARSSGRAI